MVYWFRCIRGWSICWRRRRRGIRIGPKNIPNKNANYYGNYLTMKTRIIFMISTVDGRYNLL